MGTLIQKIILVTTATLIAMTSIKVIVGPADALDRLLAVSALILFFGDQLTR